MGWKLVASGLFVVAGCSASNGDRTENEPYVPLPARAVSSAEPSPQQQKGTSSGPENSGSGAGTGAGTANGVECGSDTCSGATPQCCQGGSSASCVAEGDACGAFRESCDQASDCAPGQVCCADVLGGSATCVAASTCTGVAKMLMCVGNADCPGGTTCHAFLANINHLVCK